MMKIIKIQKTIQKRFAYSDSKKKRFALKKGVDSMTKTENNFASQGVVCPFFLINLLNMVESGAQCARYA